MRTELGTLRDILTAVQSNIYRAEEAAKKGNRAEVVLYAFMADDGLRMAGRKMRKWIKDQKAEETPHV